jgi:hypothetical protein
MHENVSRAFRNAVSRSLTVAHDLGTRFVEPYLVWRKSGDNNWTGGTEQGPSLPAIFSQGRQSFQEFGAEFFDAFARHHPEYGGKVGLPGFSMSLTASHILDMALVALWNRHRSFQVDEKTKSAMLQRGEPEFMDGVRHRPKRLHKRVRRAPYAVSRACLSRGSITVSPYW